MKWRLILATVLLAVGATDALAAPGAARGIVRPSLDINEVRVVVHWVDSVAEINDVRAEYLGARYNRRNGSKAMGFSVLRRNVTTNEYTCELYVLRPEKVDGAATLTLGHELLHCLAGNYHD